MNSSIHFRAPEPHRLIATALLVLFALMAVSVLARAQTRIKDVATVGGARDNQLIGYGIVAGLDGQGDSDKQFTQQTISNLARKFGLIVAPTDITNKNVAIVTVTANIPPFTKQGTKLNVTVASLADAKSLLWSPATVRSMPWRRAVFSSAASMRAPAGRAARPLPRTTPRRAW